MILDRIVARKQEEVLALKRKGLRPPLEAIEAPRGFRRSLLAMAKSEVAIIAEVKKASPSKGVIREDFSPLSIADAYKKGGASALSVLTDTDFFQGALSYIPQIRKKVDLPVLRKDFIIDPVQVEESITIGADAILLIAAILGQNQLQELRCQAEESGLDVLVEIHDETEAEKALASGANLIGVNNRNLRDFSVDINNTFRLRRLIPAEMPLVSESGISSNKQIRLLADRNIQAALVGESLMRCENISKGLLELRGKVVL